MSLKRSNKGKCAYDFIYFSILDTWWINDFCYSTREYHQCERGKQICISCWLGSVIDYNMFILTGHFSELDISAYCSYVRELYCILMQCYKSKKKSVQSFLSTWILSWQKKISYFSPYMQTNSNVFQLTPPPNKNISFACIPKTFPISGSVSGADNMKLAVQSSERRTFFSSYRIVSELPVR